MSTPQAFSTIFKPPIKRELGNVPFTLSSALSSATIKAPDQQVSGDLRSAVTQVSSSNNESVQGDDHSVYINMEDLAKNFRPFNPPPPPEPISDMHGQSHYRILASVTTGHSKDRNPLATVNNTRIRAPGKIVSVPFFDRMKPRRVKWVEKRGHLQLAIWQAISVKRQRKLKMKKHKYKKLMKRTRNLRRKLDRG
ncbi:MAG: hypothetical protein MMC23_006505 [Stictis urceolatum]|nr:hypothetical protein [Stictis urceolata]